MTGFDCGAFVLVRAGGVVRYVRYNRRNGCIGGIRICLGSEEGVCAARAGTEKEVHRDRRWRAVGLCAATHVENQCDERFQVGDALDRGGPIGESPLHVRQGCRRGKGHGK